jgi:hypothetical protein
VGRITIPSTALGRAGHKNWLRTKWKDRDWTEALRQQIAKGQHRHVGDLLLELGVTGANAQVWSQKHAEWERVLWHSGVPYHKHHWRDFIAWVRHSTIDDYRKRKSEHIATGMDETEAMHLAADEVVNDLKHRTRQRRRVERDQLLGVGGHEEILRRYRGNARLTDAHSRRIGKKLLQVSRLATMERALREVGYAEEDVERMMGRAAGRVRSGQGGRSGAVEKDAPGCIEKASRGRCVREGGAGRGAGGEELHGAAKADGAGRCDVGSAELRKDEV